MKRLTLIRHANTDPALGGQQDWQRTLTPRGKADAAETAQRLKKRKLKPDLLLVSTAERARATAAPIIKAWKLSAEQLRYDSRLYLADPKHLLAVIHELGGDRKHLMLIGHNPGICEFADKLAQERSLDSMPTCAVVTAKFDLHDWSELGWDSGVDVEFDYPGKV